MFACDCDNSKLVTSSYTETQHNAVCENCNQTILSRESHQTRRYLYEKNITNTFNFNDVFICDLL